MMGWDQGIIFAALLFCSLAAMTQDRWTAIFVLWMNFGATLALYASPFAVGVVDIASAAILLWSRDRRNYIIAGVFAAMIATYRFEAQLGIVATYDIVNLLAVCQYLVMGGGCFGRLYGSIQLSLRHLFGVDSRNSHSRRGDFYRSGQDPVAGNKEHGVSK